MGLKLPKLE
jgi:hypothetical protein